MNGRTTHQYEGADKARPPMQNRIFGPYLAAINRMRAREQSKTAHAAIMTGAAEAKPGAHDRSQRGYSAAAAVCVGTPASPLKHTANHQHSAPGLCCAPFPLHAPSMKPERSIPPPPFLKNL
jgi:hypothetical protein